MFHWECLSRALSPESDQEDVCLGNLSICVELTNPQQMDDVKQRCGLAELVSHCLELHDFRLISKTTLL